MAKYRTALGKTIDMSVLATKNEKVRAVGNMSVNARGDTIDAQGRVVTPVTEKVNQNYAKTVGNRSANPVRKSIPEPKKQQPPQPQVEELVELRMNGGKLLVATHDFTQVTLLGLRLHRRFLHASICLVT